MKYLTFMVVAGEASGDILAAELVQALKQECALEPRRPAADHQPLHADLAPRFFGAGGSRMRAAGVDICFDLTAHAVTGLTDVLKKLLQFRRCLLQLTALAAHRQPDVVVCVDFSGFNRRLARALRRRSGRPGDWFHPWRPCIVQYVSPQVWASRPGRAEKMAGDFDLLLSTFPFEKDWYARRVPGFPVEFVGNPILDRYAHRLTEAGAPRGRPTHDPTLLLLPGSRVGEIQRHLPVMLEAARQLHHNLHPLEVLLVFPAENLLELAKAAGLPPWVRPQVGGLEQALSRATVAIASTGTVLLECACLGVPMVAMYKTSALTYQVGKRIVTVPYMAMPNLLANRPVVPEFIQSAATPQNIARAAHELFSDPQAHARARQELARVVQSLGEPGGSRRAARAILSRL